MSLSAIARLVAILVLGFASTPLVAQVHAACCRCASFYEVSDKGAGFLRHHVGFCPKCTTEMGGGGEAYLARLRGRHGGLADAAGHTNRRLMEAIRQRDAARDSIYGRDGTMFGASTALLSLASEGVSGTFKNIAKAAKEGVKWYNRVADTLEGNTQWVLDAGKDWVRANTVGAAEDKAKLKVAAAAGRAYYERTKDARGATQVFLQSRENITKGVSVVQSAIKFHDKLGKFADSLQAYLEHRADAQRLHAEWEQITDDMLKLEEEMKKLQHCLDLMQQQAQGKSAGHSPEHGWGARFAAADPIAEQRRQLKALVYPENEPNESALRSALDSARLAEADAADLVRHLEQEFIPPLLPFWYDLQAELGRDYARALLEWADPASDKAVRLFDRAVRRANGAVDEAKRARPRD